MKTNITWITTLMITLFSYHSNAQWEPTNGPMGGYIRAIISDDEIVYATTGGGGVLASDDDGSSWNFKNDGIVSYDVKSFALSGNTLFVSCDENVYRTNDQGENWEPAGTEMEDKYTKTLLAFDNIIFAGTYLFGVYRSTDNGSTWQAVNNGLPAKYIYWLETDGENIYAGTYQDGMYKSVDYGESWTSINNGLGELNIMSIYSFEEKIFTSTLSSGVFVSEDNGENWTPTLTNIPSVKGFTSIGNNLFAASFGNGVYHSTDSGITWQILNNGLSEQSIWAIHANDNDLYVGVTSGHIYRSANMGSSWNLCNGNITWKASIGSVSSFGGRVFAGSHGAGFYITDNGGNNWTKAGSIWTVEIRSILANESVVLAGTDMLGIFKSTNNGNSFSMSNAGLNSKWIQAFTSCENKIFAGSREEGLFVSSNNASNWTSVDASLISNNIQALSSNDPYILAGTADLGVFVSDDMGVNWVQSNSGLPDVNITALHYGDELFIAGTKSEGVFASDNNGSTWYSLNNDLPPQSNIRSITSHETDLFVSTGAGQIFASYNKGVSWEEVAANQSQTPVFSLWPCEDDGYLYIGINVDAVYKRPLDQFTGSKISNENDPVIVYPNPVKEHLFIDTGTPIDKCSLKIYNAKGQLIVSKSLLNEESFIDMTRYPNGIYFLNVLVDGKTLSKKIMKH